MSTISQILLLFISFSITCNCCVVDFYVDLTYGIYRSEVRWWIKQDGVTFASGTSSDRYNIKVSGVDTSRSFQVSGKDTFGDSWNGAVLRIYKYPSYEVNQGRQVLYEWSGPTNSDDKRTILKTANLKNDFSCAPPCKATVEELACSSGFFAGTGIDCNLDKRFICMACPPGKYQNNANSTFCFGCEPGLYNPDFGRKTTCYHCIPGRYTSFPYYNATTCMDCSKGKYSTNNAGVNEDSCISCEPGKYHSANGRGYGCTDCGLGEIGNLPLSATSCIKCSSGFYNDDHRQIKCKGCAAGKYTNMYYSNSYSLRMCKSCTAGYFANKLSNATGCTVCLPGYYTSQNMQITCKSCAAGKYSTVSATGICLSCQIGFFANKPMNATACLNCPIGKYNEKKEAISCIGCRNGTVYRTNGNSPYCVPCGPGKYTNRRTNTCDNCIAGFFSDLIENDNCRFCTSKSTSNKLSGSTSCSSCPLGKTPSLNYYLKTYGFCSKNVESIEVCKKAAFELSLFDKNPTVSDYGNVKNPRCWYEFQEDIDRLKFREYIYEDSYSYNEQCSPTKPCICEYDSSAFQNIYSYEKRDTGICSETNEVLSKEECFHGIISLGYHVEYTNVRDSGGAFRDYAPKGCFIDGYTLPSVSGTIVTTGNSLLAYVSQERTTDCSSTYPCVCRKSLTGHSAEANSKVKVIDHGTCETPIESRSNCEEAAFALSPSATFTTMSTVAVPSGCSLSIPQYEFVLNDYDCYSKIDSEDECIEAGKIFDLEYGGKIDSYYYPKRCFLQGSKLYYNDRLYTYYGCGYKGISCLCRQNSGFDGKKWEYIWNEPQIQNTKQFSKSSLGVCSTSCTSCQAGKYSQECLNCPAGRYNERYDSSRIEMLQACKKCPEGRVGFEVGKNDISTACSCRVPADCFACPVGTYGIVEVALTDCPADLVDSCFVSKSFPGIRLYYSNAVCALCPNGKVGLPQKKRGSTKGNVVNRNMAQACVTTCPTGMYKRNIFLSTQSHYYTSILHERNDTIKEICENCPAGKMSMPDGSCELCSAGKYQSMEGQTECQKCEKKYQSMEGQTECQKCLSGYIPFEDEEGLNIGCQPDPVITTIIVLLVILSMCLIFTYISYRYRIYLQKKANVEFHDDMVKLTSNPNIQARFRSSSLFKGKKSIIANIGTDGTINERQFAGNGDIELNAVGISVHLDETIHQEWDQLEKRIYEAKTSIALVETFNSMLKLIIKTPELKVEKEELISIASSKRVSLLRHEDDESQDVWNSDVARAFGKVLAKMK